MRAPFIVLFFSILAALLWLAVNFTPQPFRLSDDMVLAKAFSKRLEVPQKDQFFGSTYYNDDMKQKLGAVTDAALQELRCSATIMRNNQGVYVLEHERAENKRTKRIKNDEFIEFMREKERTLPVGKKILTGRVCETKDDTILLFYSIGVYDVHMVDKTNIRKAILYSTNNTAYLQVLPKYSLSKAEPIELSVSNSHTRCEQPFYIQKNQTLTVLCLEEVDWSSNYYVKQINIKDGTVTTVQTCKNRFEEYINDLKEVTCS